ncbi:microtubule-associated protein 9 isoform X2 [Brienomyrus brachyistius]|nr:microtubule-associated protein 9 isoform X2 [Brienomyrus brachyistius]XP_048855784.1 microtubule-associated protein 9 isoform X2 [Brienomyrus brachyistius]XP_048855786.1 microtubule-associated protein 9 isoform X2 [Brienomyrus brachyistius]
MEDVSLGTMLAYTRSRKTSRRTTFQDELQAAISARAQRSTYEERYSYADDFDDEDDIFKELLHFSKQKKTGALKLDKKKSKINDFRLSDDEDENAKPKRVSFLKTQKKTSCPPPEVPEQRQSPEAPVDNGSDGSHSDFVQPVHSRSNVLDSRESPTLERGQWECPSPRDTGEVRPEARIADEEDSSLQPKEPSTLQSSSTCSGSVLEDELPKPKPRQRTLKFPTNMESESLPERPLTSSVSIPLYPTEMDSITNRVFHSSSPQRAPREDVSVSAKFSTQTFSAEDQLDISVHKSTPGSVSKESCALEDGEEGNSQKNSTSFEEKQEDTADGSQLSGNMESCVAENSYKARERPASSFTARSQRTQICRPHTAQSRYLGTLKVLDHKVYTKESQAENADSLRATVYQEWLKGKDQKTKETLRVKKQEEKTLAEKKIQEALDKTGEAKASFEAWKEKKAEVTKTKMRAEREKIRKQQMETDEKEEKREEAKKVFEKWKQDQDKCLRERQQTEKVSESRLKQKREEQTEMRRRECTSAFSKWSEKKEEVIQEKVKSERRQKKIKEEEEKYEKEEKSRMALEMYETWMRRKERQRRRERRQRRIDSILLEAPPPWSPPSKTVPYGK